ncbi:YaaC family protein [Aciduricibacillus chroicocephali]|uniref:YaaC family protein n=1 Tax=Aciduricibacillus chroicocephali TaxID=3054939 RepID=A0ABY9KYE7_9BACI|nr:YaaC family protein [Bacillaceae bacterium 44XB]
MIHLDARMYFSCLSSQKASYDFLTACYKRRNIEDADALAYSNAQAFLHYNTQGLDLYEQGIRLPQSMKPLLYFYGAAHLVKGCLLTVCPGYPEQTSQLAHGVSARKRKKRDFVFLQDEVKIQHQGLFPCLAEYLFGISQFTELKIPMADLIAAIPEMITLLARQKGSTLAAVGNVQSKQIILPEAMCDGHHATWQTLLRRIASGLPKIQHYNQTSNGLEVLLEEVPSCMNNIGFFTAGNGTIYTGLVKNTTSGMSEMMIHYLLLYNLSMLSRYETEWWGDLLSLREDLDYQAISIYLDTAALKFPLLAAAWLNAMENGKNPGAAKRRD